MFIEKWEDELFKTDLDIKINQNKKDLRCK